LKDDLQRFIDNNSRHQKEYSTFPFLNTLFTKGGSFVYDEATTVYDFYIFKLALIHDVNCSGPGCERAAAPAALGAFNRWFMSTLDM
jgi:hypothetical protein